MIIYTPPKPTASIPVVDLAGTYADEAARRAVARTIHEACRDIGFFYVKNHGIPPHVLDEQLAWGKRFFALPLDAKMKIKKANTRLLRGYEPMQGQVLDLGSPPDLKEDFQMARHLDEDHPLVQQGIYNHGPNRWPEDLPGFREHTEAYHAQMMTLGVHLFRLLALSLDLAEDYFDDGMEDPNCSVRMLHYPPHPQAAAANQLGAGAHTDWGGLTMLLQDESGGLEVRNAAGEWLQATPIPGTLVVNLGEMVRRWTNDIYQSTLHRVKNVSGVDRYSIAAFFNPHYFYMVECVPTCRPADGTPRYAPCTAGEHSAEMARLTYGSAKQIAAAY